MSTRRSRDVLTPIETKPHVRKIAALDLEGAGGVDSFVSASIVDGQRKVFTKSRDTLFDEMFSKRYRGTHFYVHYLSYDFGMMLPFIPLPFKAYLVRGKVYRVVISDGNKHTFYLNDSLGMFYNLALSVVGNAIGLPKLPTPPEFTSDAKVVPEWRCEEHDQKWCPKCYNVRDAEIVYRAMIMYQDTMLSLGSEVRNTLASTAMTLFRRSFLDREYVKPFPYRNEFARLAYYGGRVEPFIWGETSRQNYYDFHSLYAAMMHNHPYPDPDTFVGPWENRDIRFIFEYEGFSEVMVKCPSMHIPILPYRHKGKLYFPKGTMRGVWAHCELRYAVSLGYQIKAIYRTMFAKGTCNPFVSYVDALWSLRQEAKGRGDQREVIYKTMANSLYGKFGQRSGSGLDQLFRLEDIDEDADLTGYQMMEILDCVYVRKPLGGSDEPAYVIVPWAAYTTAYARIHLHQAMQRADFQVSYTDTDSIFTSLVLPTSSGLGDLGVVDTDLQLQVYAPKFYRYVTPQGKERIACRGVPAEYRAQYISTKEVAFQKAVGIYEAAVRNLTPSEWITTTRHMRYADPKRDYYRIRGSPQGLWQSRAWAVEHLP